jgi:hypothetical protein
MLILIKGIIFTVRYRTKKDTDFRRFLGKWFFPALTAVFRLGGRCRMREG